MREALCRMEDYMCEPCWMLPASNRHGGGGAEAVRKKRPGTRWDGRSEYGIE